MKSKFAVISCLITLISSTSFSDNGQFTFDYTDSSTQYSNPLNGLTTEKFTVINGQKLVTQITKSIPNSSQTMTTQYGYDANGRPSYVISPNGNKTTYQYDDKGLLESKAQASGTPLELDTAYVWDTNLRLPKQLNIKGFYTENFAYDAHGQPLTITKSDGKASEVQHYTYDKNELVTSFQAPFNTGTQLTHYAYKNGLLASITNPLNQVTTFNSYDAGGYVTSITDPNNVISKFTYDPMDLLTGQNVNGAIAQYQYDNNSHVSQITDADGVVYKPTYNYWGKLKAKQDAQGNKIQYLLNGLGETIEAKTTDKSGKLTKDTKYLYDPLGRLTTVVDAYGNTIKYSYDNDGNISSITDALDHTTKKQYNLNDQVSQQTNPLTNSLLYTYDALGNLTSFTDYNGHQTTYHYNGLGHLIEEDGPDRGKITYGYNSGGQLISKTDANNSTIGYSYDPLNRLTGVTFSNGKISYNYDQGTYGKGRLSSVTNGKIQVDFGYNPWGSLTKESSNDGDKTYNVSYEYSPAQRIKSITYPDGAVVSYVYNSNGNVASVAINKTAVASDITYAPFGPFLTMKLGNGSEISRSYNLNYQLTKQTVTNADSDDYAYDADGNVTKFVNNLSPNESKNYTYDAENRITEVKSQLATIDYTYGANGNRKTKSSTKDGQTNYQYSQSNDQLTAAGTKAVTHDSVGNIIALGNFKLTYNALNQLLAVSQSGKDVESYEYNGLGQRVTATASGAITHFVYDRNGRIIEIDQGGNTTDFVYLNGEPLAEINQGKTYYFINNRLGTPEYLTDSSNQSQWHGNIYPFKVDAAGKVFQPLRFPGQIKTGSTGFIYNNARDYSSDSGRFLESDPLGLSGGSSNLYTYVNNNPSNLIDPKGTCIEDACIIEGAAVVEAAEEVLPYVEEGAEYLAQEVSGAAEAAENYFEGASEPEAIADETGASSEQICPAKDLYKRPSGFRTGVRDQVWDQAKGVNDEVRDPLTGQIMSKDNPWDMGHKPGYEFWKHRESAYTRGISRKQFLDEHNNPNHYQPELPSSNRSHIGEDTTNKYFGP